MRPELMVLMVQKEVGERICAPAGEMSVLSVLCQYYADCKIISYVSQNCFWPEPEVESVIVKLKIKNKHLDYNLVCHPEFISGSQEREKIFNKEMLKQVQHDRMENDLKGNKEFFRLVKIGFSARRKMLKNNLAAGLKIEPKRAAEILKEFNLSEKIRPQELTVSEWLKIFDKMPKISYN